MKRAVLVALGIGAIVSSAAAFSIGAAGEGGSLTREQYAAKLRLIEASHGARMSGCDAMQAAARESCRLEAEGDQAVRAAEVEAAYRRTRQATRAAQRARIEARYQAERARCASLGGARRDSCMVQVHATRGRAMLDAAAPYEVRL